MEKMNKEYIQGKAGNALIDLTERVRKDFGNTLKEIKSLDNTLSESERIAISHIEKRAKKKCPELKKEEKFFYYCGKNFNGAKYQKRSLYQKRVESIEIQFYCLDKFRNCGIYSGNGKKH